MTKLQQEFGHSPLAGSPCASSLVVVGGLAFVVVVEASCYIDNRPFGSWAFLHLVSSQWRQENQLQVDNRKSEMVVGSDEELCRLVVE